MDDEKNIPYGILKQAFMKLESFTEDMHECLNYDMSEEDKYECSQMMEVATTMSMRILNIVRQGMNEEDFINEKVDMDKIGQFPEHLYGRVYTLPYLFFMKHHAIGTDS